MSAADARVNQFDLLNERIEKMEKKMIKNGRLKTVHKIHVTLPTNNK